MSLVGMAKGEPLVTVFCLTFNQKDYIKQCIDSLLEQKVKFAYEILINDDASNDGTFEILEEYKEKYPEIIKIVSHEENQFSKGKRSFIARYLLPLARGKYFAVCEGDDYWIDSLKLQKQVDFMEENKDNALCFHPVEIRTEGSKDTEIFPGQKKDRSVERLLRENFIHTNSVMYRRQTYDEIRTDVMPADWYLHLYHAQYGSIGFIDAVMSVYRKHKDSMWASVRSDKEIFWRKFGSMHLVFHARILELYGKDSKLKKIIESNITNTASTISNELPDAEEIITKAIEKAPPIALTIINSIEKDLVLARENARERDRLVYELQTAIDQLRAEMVLIKSSKVWRLRNAFANILGKKKV